MGAGCKPKRTMAQLGSKRSSVIPMDTYLMRRRLQWYGQVRRRAEQKPKQQVLSMTVQYLVPALGDPRRERPPAVCGHFLNVPTHFEVKLPVISGHLPNADADSHLLVVCTCYNGQCKQMPRFRWSFQPKIASAHPNLRPTDLSNVRAVVW